MPFLQGFVPLYREEVLGNPWLQKHPETVLVYVYLICSANFAPSMVGDVLINPGELVTSYAKLADETGHSIKTVRTCLQHLERSQYVAIERAQRQYTKITLLHWKNWHGDSEEWHSDGHSSGRTMGTEGAQDGHTNGQHNKKGIEKGDKGKESGAPAPSAKRFTPPTIEEVRAYCLERGSSVDAQRFVDFYEASGWRRGKTPIRDWKACVRTWERGDASSGQAGRKESDPYAGYERF